MIKTGIAGADSEIAGGLIRILVNHPEVDLLALQAPGKAGIKVSSVHYGLMGETPLVFTDSVDLSKLDLLFICNDLQEMRDAAAKAGDSLKVIDVCGFSRKDDYDGEEYIFGLSEINRKPLVRGAMKARLPLPVSSVCLVALYPLAKNLLLNNSLKLTAEIPASLTDSVMKSDSVREINSSLSEIQLSFSDGICADNIITRQSPERGIRVTVTLDSNLSLEELERLYLEIYDDHNFTIISRSPVEMKEILATDRIVVSLFKDSPTSIRIEAIADEEMRGGAAEAVHIMNLLFGLHEKTGMIFLPTAR